MGTSVATPKPDAGLEALQKELAASKKEVEQLKTRPAQQQVQQPQQQPNGQPSKQDIEKIFWADPLPMMDAVAKRAAWEAEQRIMHQNLGTNRQVARDKARETDPAVFDMFEAEIEKMVGLTQEQFHGNIQVWTNALSMVRGQHVDEIIEARAKAKGEPVNNQQQQSRGDGPAQPSTRQPPAPKEKPLSDDQKEVARGLHLTEAEYRRGIHRYENQEKEWPKVVTFSSEEKRRAATAKRNAAAAK